MSDDANWHPTEDSLLAFADRATTASSGEEISRHVEACAACAAQLEEIHALDSTLQSALLVLDAREPAEWREGASRKTARVRPLKVAPGPAHSAARSITRLQWAAVALICIAGIASGMPLLRRYRYAATEARAIAARPTDSVTTAAVIVPTGDSVAVIVDGAGANSRVTLTRVDVPMAGVRVDVTGSLSPAFSPDSSTVSVSLRGRTAAVHVTVPGQVRQARVEVNGRVVARFNGTAVVPAAAREGGIIVTW
jgi:anti-sigma factor RsiW